LQWPLTYKLLSQYQGLQNKDIV
jgi:hypothetical protein